MSEAGVYEQALDEMSGELFWGMHTHHTPANRSFAFCIILS